MKQQTTLFDNLKLLPVESVSYSVDDGAEYPTARVEGGDPDLPPEVIGPVGEADVDTRPVSNTLEDTFVRRDEQLGAESVPGGTATTTSRSRGRGRGRCRSRSPDRVACWCSPTVTATWRSRSPTTSSASSIRFDAEALGIAPSYDVLVDATTVGDAHQMNSVDDAEAAMTDVPGRLVQHGPGWPAGRDADQGQPGRGGPGRR